MGTRSQLAVPSTILHTILHTGGLQEGEAGQGQANLQGSTVRESIHTASTDKGRSHASAREDGGRRMGAVGTHILA